MRKFYLLIFNFFSCLVVFSQNIDSLSAPLYRDQEVVLDSTEVEKERGRFFKRILDKTYPNPLRAAALSFVLPGSGQIYNKKWWKAPIVYGALGFTGYLIIDNTNNYRDFKEAYLSRVDDDPNTIDRYPNASEATLLSIRNGYDKRRQQSYVGFFAVWFLNSLDAFVDAHLVSFDVDEDLSMVVKPTSNYDNATLSFGIGISLQPKNVIAYPLYFE